MSALILWLAHLEGYLLLPERRISHSRMCGISSLMNVTRCSSHLVILHLPLSTHLIMIAPPFPPRCPLQVCIYADMRRDVQEIFKMTPHDKQVMMFSATLSKEIRPVCKKFMQDVMFCSLPQLSLPQLIVFNSIAPVVVL